MKGIGWARVVLAVTGGIVTWLTSGAILAGAIALLLAARLGRQAGMSKGWSTLTLVIAALLAIGAVLPLFDVYPIDDLLLLVTAGVLLPIWAIWMAARAPLLWPAPAEAGATIPTT